MSIVDKNGNRISPPEPKEENPPIGNQLKFAFLEFMIAAIIIVAITQTDEDMTKPILKWYVIIRTAMIIYNLTKYGRMYKDESIGR